MKILRTICINTTRILWHWIDSNDFLSGANKNGARVVFTVSKHALLIIIKIAKSYILRQHLGTYSVYSDVNELIDQKPYLHS